ncbi:MAG: UDP-2,3-diacylglucosamine diphosphatase [Flavobacteriia bacterium]|jgi:UDP-2,3-diacylglucosamine pyrophosphatase LpxH
MQQKRDVELVVISDVHLGTYGARASELVSYLRSIQPRTLVLNGDIIDIWQFSKHYFPADHMQVLKEITSLLSKGTKVYYITGNHDEMLRKFKGFSMGNFEIQNKLILPLTTGTAWIFHGDVFDTTMKHSKWIAKLGGKGYDLLIMLNTVVNWFSEKMGRGRVSLSKKVKDSVKGVIKFVNNFEETAAEIAINNGYQFVVCGHIHHPQIKKMTNANGESVMYLNSGDWVENSTALEYDKEQWTLYKHVPKSGDFVKQDSISFKNALSYDQLLQEVVSGLNFDAQ